MKANMRNKCQVFSVGNYLMTGKVFGKGHFARVEEATHRIIGKKVAIKIIDLTCIKEEYARRNLHREPRVMAKLRHPCIAALYETMMHGPRLYVVMEAAGGGDLCAHVLAARGGRGARGGGCAGGGGLPEARARPLAAQLVSAVRHMHARGVVHRDLKMENIMLDASKQFIKIVDFGLSNTWSSGGALRTPCGSLEYAAPELFVDGRKYGPEVDLWSIGVIVYGMVTGGLPFGSGGGGGTTADSRPQLRASIAAGFARKQRAALACATQECRAFIQHLLEPDVELRMKIEEAAQHRWIRRPGMRMKTHPLAAVEPKLNREVYKQISELCGLPIMEVVAQIKGDPFGAIAGIYNIKVHLHQMQAVPGADLLWSSTLQDGRPTTPPEYKAKMPTHADNVASSSKPINQTNQSNQYTAPRTLSAKQREPTPSRVNEVPKLAQTTSNPIAVRRNKTTELRVKRVSSQSPRLLAPRPVSGTYGLRSPVYKVYENGDCLDSRLPSINEHSTDMSDAKQASRRIAMAPCVKKTLEEERPIRLNSCPHRSGENRRAEFYRKAGDGLPSWRACGTLSTPPARILLQTNASTIKRASLGNITSPHSSTNSQCKSERAIPVSCYVTRPMSKDAPNLQRLRRSMALK